MALLLLAGMDFRPTLRSSDPVAVQVDQAVAERALRLRAEIEGKRLDTLARNIGTHVGNAIVRQLGPALQNLGRALGG